MATFTVREPGWKRYSGQRSRVPPARSARTGARTVTLFIRSEPCRVLEECPASWGEFCHLGGRRGEFRRKTDNVASELLRQRHRERVGGNGFQFERIQPDSAIGDAIVEMRSGRQSGCTDVADHFSLHHLVSAFDAFSEAGQVQIVGVEARCVTDADVVAFAAFLSGFDDDTVRCGHDRRADWRAVIDAVMGLEAVQDGMVAALGELRGDARELQGSAEELLAQRAAAAAVVPSAAIRPFLTESLEGLSAMGEARGQNGAVADRIRSAEALLHHQAERVAALQRKEIDVPLENVDDLLRELWTLAGHDERVIERTVDAGGNDAFDFADRCRLRHDQESCFVAHGVQLAPAGDLHLHAIDATARFVMKADEIARLQTPQVETA